MKKAIDNKLPDVNIEKVSKNEQYRKSRLLRANKALAAENKRMKARLANVHGKYNVKKWESEYNSHIQVSNQISRVVRPPSIVKIKISIIIFFFQNFSFYRHAGKQCSLSKNQTTNTNYK